MKSSENGRILLTAFLQKRSRIFHMWRSRFCVLTEKYLITYKGTEKNSESTESLNLSECSSVSKADQSLGKNNTFLLVHRNRNYYFLCKNSAEQEEWVETIEQIIEMNNEIKNKIENDNLQNNNNNNNNDNNIKNDG